MSVRIISRFTGFSFNAFSWAHHFSPEHFNTDRADKTEPCKSGDWRCKKAGSQNEEKNRNSWNWFLLLVRSMINEILIQYANKQQPKFKHNVTFKSFKRYDLVIWLVYLPKIYIHSNWSKKTEEKERRKVGISILYDLTQDMNKNIDAPRSVHL